MLMIVIAMFLSDFTAVTFYFAGKPVVWFLGHSLIRRLGEFVRGKKIATPFRPVWEGIGGAGVERTKRSFLSMLARWPEPAMVILHTGSNDLGTMPTGQLRRRLVELMALVKAALPRSTVVWSDMLPRRQYRGARNDKAVKDASVSVNRYLRTFAARNGMRAVRHIRVSADNGVDFLHDGVHLSQQGNSKFQAELWLAIEAFRSSDIVIFQGQ